jgi:hypothetical protein
MRNQIAGGLLLSLLAVACGGADKMSARAPEASEAKSGGGYAPSSPAAPMAYPQPAAPPPPGVVAGDSAKASSVDAAPDAPAVATSTPAREPARPLPQSGQLTAGIWDDNRNFDFFKPYATTFKTNNGADFNMFAAQEMETARDVANKQQAGHNEVDIQLVLDTTGSMGDELSYLQSEFDSIAARLKTKFPNVTPHWSLVVYRDKGDDYLTREFDFTTDTAKFRKDLRAQSAGGGGDTPEAVVQGLDVGSRMTWRSSASVAKIAFWVADAPAHPGEGKQLATVVRNIKAKGIHVYPIAASDTDDAAEYQMRSTAQMTGGRYLFLTNDSGVGNDHSEPHIPCYAVTKLDNAIVRSIETELTGHRVEASSSDVIRNVGQPDKEGRCKLASGALVASF